MKQFSVVSGRLSVVVLVALWGTGVAFGAAVDGKDIVLHGNANGALPCAACHGVNGAGNASIGAPALAGVKATVIEAYLKQFAAGTGGNAVMQVIARALSPAEIAAVAGYFAGLPAK
jgi:cytochrome c553